MATILIRYGESNGNKIWNLDSVYGLWTNVMSDEVL
jgi:hypothetical protein